MSGAKLHKVMYLGKRKIMRGEEYHQRAEAFRHIAQRLQAHADEIDVAKMS